MVGDERIHENLNAILLILRKLFPLSYYLFQFRIMNEYKGKDDLPVLVQKSFVKYVTYSITILVYPTFENGNENKYWI